jgi:3-oxoacyl-[acyl-carrier protein] reductase
VTGESRGLGRAIAFVGAGADVAVKDEENRSAADEVVETITKCGHRSIAIGAGVSMTNEVQSMTATIAKSARRYRNLGQQSRRRVRSKDRRVALALFDEAISANSGSAFRIWSAGLPAMRRSKWGRLILISSTAANVGRVVGPHYAASKDGLIGLMH